MDKLAIGLWGCFFGAVTVILLGSAFAYARSLHRIAMNATLSAASSDLYVAVFLGGLPVGDEQAQAQGLAVVALAVSGVLTYLVFAVLGFFKSTATRLRALALLCVLLLGWLLPAKVLSVLSTSVACLLGLVALGATLKRAFNGDRLACAVGFAICCMLVAMLGLSAQAPSSAASDVDNVRL